MVNPPPAESSQPSREFVSCGLGDAEVDRLLNLSPCARTMLREATKGKRPYQIQWGDPGKGTYCDRGFKKIVIDPKLKGEPALVAGALCHELGHATSNRPGFDVDAAKRCEWIEENLPRAVGRAVGSAIGQWEAGKAFGQKVGRRIEKWTEDLYVAYNVRQDLTDEGHADMKLAACVKQAWAAVEHSGDRRLMWEVYRMWHDGDEALRQKEAALWYETQKGKLSLRKAEEQIGDYYADHEHPSTNPRKTYRQQYEESWHRVLDLHPKGREQAGQEPAPANSDGFLVNAGTLTPYRPWEGRVAWGRDDRPACDRGSSR